MTWTTTDPVTFEEWQTAFDQAQRDPLFQRVRPVKMIVDLRERVVFGASSSIPTLAASLRDRLARRAAHPHIRVAFVVSNAIGHGMVRMTEAYAEDFLEVEIFRSLDDAQGWLLDTGIR